MQKIKGDNQNLSSSMPTSAPSQIHISVFISGKIVLVLVFQDVQQKEHLLQTKHRLKNPTLQFTATFFRNERDKTTCRYCHIKLHLDPCSVL